MRYGFWLPVFGGWLRNIDDEQMPATWDYVRDLTLSAEDLGYDLTLIAELNLNDIKGPEADSLDAWSTAAALAAVTNKLELMVAVRPTFHNPALLAKQAANIDRITNGRLTLNVVSSWWRDEALKYGIPFDEHDDRYARTAEWLDVLDQLLVATTHHPHRPLLQHRRQHPLAPNPYPSAPTPAPQHYPLITHPLSTAVPPSTPAANPKPPKTSSPPSATPTSCTATTPPPSPPKSPTCAHAAPSTRTSPR